MLFKLKLRGDELLVYAIIFGFTHGNQDWEIRYDYISQCLGLTHQEIQSILDCLCCKGLIIFNESGNVEITKID